MTKKEFLEVLVKELERLEKEEHVSDLANNGRYAEVDAIVAQIDYSTLMEYMDEEGGDADLSMEDIPKPYVLTFAIYLSGSDYDECDVMEEWEDLQDALYECGDAGKAIADTMSHDEINVFETFEELVLGETADEDEDEEEEDPDEDGDEEESDEDDEEPAK